MHHGLSEILRFGQALIHSLGDLAGCPVVLDYVRMVDGDVGRALVEVLDRIAALAHHVDDEAVCRPDCSARGLDEPRLDLLPRGPVGRLSLLVERAGLEPRTSLDARLELGLGAAAVAQVLGRPLVLGSERLAQPLGPRPPASAGDGEDEGEDDEHDRSDDGDPHPVFHSQPLRSS